jgi:hypothetical protein
MNEPRSIPEPGELVYLPRSSWVPAILAFALALTLCGVFISFMLPGWIYAIIGGVVALFAFRNLVRGAIRDYFSLPRKQRVRGAVLPVETIQPPPRP